MYFIHMNDCYYLSFNSILVKKCQIKYVMPKSAYSQYIVSSTIAGTPDSYCLMQFVQCSRYLRDNLKCSSQVILEFISCPWKINYPSWEHLCHTQSRNAELSPASEPLKLHHIPGKQSNAHHLPSTDKLLTI